MLLFQLHRHVQGYPLCSSPSLVNMFATALLFKKCHTLSETPQKTAECLSTVFAFFIKYVSLQNTAFTFHNFLLLSL